MTRRARLAFLAALLLSGCGSAPEKPAPKPRDPQLLRFATHWQALKRRYPGTDPTQSFAQPCYETPQLRVELLRALDPLEAPTPELQGAEVLIAIEGNGSIEVAGKLQPFTEGMVAVLPAGARGVLRGTRGDPARKTKDELLLVLAIRHSDPIAVTEGKPVVLQPHQVWKDEVFRGASEGVFERQVAAIPGGVALHALEVRGGANDLKQMAFWGIPSRVRTLRDQVFLQVSEGMGSFGTRGEGNAVQFLSLVGIPATIEHHYTSYEPTGSKFLVVLAPATTAESIDDDVQVLTSK